MLRIRSYISNLPFHYPFETAHGLKTHQPALMVSLSNGVLTGYGEAPAIHYYGSTAEAMQETLLRYTPAIARYAMTDPPRFWHFLHHLIPKGNNPLMAALDMAAWDLYGKMRRAPLYQLLGYAGRDALPTDYTIGYDTAEKMLQKIAAKPWPAYKIKITGAADIELLKTLRAATGAPFRVDANESLTFTEATALLPQLLLLGVTMLEQPLPRGDWEAMKMLKAQSPLPLFADEACHEEKDLDACAAAYHGIVIKLTKCGGITPALRMLEAARSKGLRVMIGSMNESMAGTAALVHLSYGADLADTDGPLLLDGDAATGLTIHPDGRLAVSHAPGLGITPADPLLFV